MSPLATRKLDTTTSPSLVVIAPKRRLVAAAVLKDVAKLKQPREVALIFALVAETVSPFGLNVGPWGARITAVLLAVGLVASYIEKLRSVKA